MRIGEALDLDEDIYSMLFVLCLSQEQHFYYMNIAGGEFDFVQVAEDDNLSDIPEDDANFKAKTIAREYGRMPE